MKKTIVKKLIKKRKSTSMLIAFLMLFCTAAAFGQGRTITGAVIDQKGEPVIGASVTEKGTANGTITDVDGKFNLRISDKAVLVISYIGYQTIEQAAGNQQSVTVTLKEDTKSIDEVVVIGYGTRAKKDLTGAVSQITNDEITKQVNLSPEFSMQGKIAGVFVSNTGSNPVGRPTVRIRGVTTLGYNEPLYVVDGVPLTEGGSGVNDGRVGDLRGEVNVFNMINANDIETISVLKDASATAIYGVRASNGVILITTKRGSEGKARVNVTASYGMQNINKRYDLVSQQEFVDMTMEAMKNNTAYTPDYWYPLFDKNSPEYMGNKPNHQKEWMDALLNKNAPIQDYNISISGGTKMSNYSLGAGYANQEDALGKDSFGRYSFFLNSDHKLTKWLKMGESYRFIYSTYASGPSNDFYGTSFMVPWQPLYDASQPNGIALPGRNFVRYGDTQPTFNTYGYGMATRNNFLGMREYQHYERQLMRNLGSFYAELSPLPGLRFKGTFSFDYYTNTMEKFTQPENELYGVSNGKVGVNGNSFVRRVNENVNIVKEFLIGYTNKFGEHSVDLIGNIMSQAYQWNNSNMSNDKFTPFDDWSQRRIDEGWPIEEKNAFYERSHSGLLGYMGRLSYNYLQKYYLDATVRRDGTSKFGPGYKWGTFPSFAAAWRISSESFMKDLTWMNDLKIRGGWGQTGNQETADFAYIALMNFNPVAVFGNQNLYRGAALANFPVNNMTWETVSTFSLGFDLVALKNKLNFTAEYYSRDTKGILQRIVIPWTLGAPGSPMINLATVSNKGVEFQAGYNDRFGDIGVNASLNLTTVKNMVNDLYRGQRQGGGNIRIQNGYSLNYIYGYKTAGIFQTKEEIAEWSKTHDDVGLMSQKSPGDVIFMDINRAPNGNDPKEQGLLEVNEPDGKINSYDQTYLGKTIPGYYYGFTLGADYKKWDINLMFRGVGDVQGINSMGVNSISGGGDNILAVYRKRWTPDNPSTTIPRAVQNDPSGNNRVSDRQVHSAAFLRFQNFQIGYNFRGNFLNRAGISNLRCYVSGSNIFVIAPGWPDLDPENVTTPTTFTLGVNLSF